MTRRQPHFTRTFPERSPEELRDIVTACQTGQDGGTVNWDTFTRRVQASEDVGQDEARAILRQMQVAGLVEPIDGWYGQIRFLFGPEALP